MGRSYSLAMKAALAALLTIFALAGSTVTFALILQARRDELPSGNESLIAATIGIAALVIGLVVIRPRWPKLVTSLLGYGVLVVPTQFLYGCGYAGACI
jgi:hypothetical protein